MPRTPSETAVSRATFGIAFKEERLENIPPGDLVSLRCQQLVVPSGGLEEAWDKRDQDSPDHTAQAGPTGPIPPLRATKLVDIQPLHCLPGCCCHDRHSPPSLDGR